MYARKITGPYVTESESEWRAVNDHCSQLFLSKVFNFEHDRMLLKTAFEQPGPCVSFRPRSREHKFFGQESSFFRCGVLTAK